MTHTSPSEFTKRAADRLWERVSSSALCRNNVDADRPRLAQLSTDGDNRIKQLVQKTFANCNISHIHQVYAPHMYGMYLLRKEEMKLNVGQSVQEKILFHVTTESRALESLDSGLNWRRTIRDKFGCGVSFSENADYANYYADNSTGEDKRVIMICSVLVRKTYVVPRFNNGNTLTVPPDRSDTTMSSNGYVYVKYNDNEFYPLYFVYYRLTPEHLIKSKFSHANTRRNRGHRYGHY